MSTTSGKGQPQVRIPADAKPYPKHHEVTAASILVGYFKQDVYFVGRLISKTADFKIGKTYWELKSPTGMGKNNIQHALKAALKQSDHIVFDARFSKHHQNRIVSELRAQIQKLPKLKGLLLITKRGDVVKMK